MEPLEQTRQRPHPVALRPDQLEQLANALNVSISDLLEDKEEHERKRGTGPTGKMKQLFEKASELPRHQQQKPEHYKLTVIR